MKTKTIKKQASEPSLMQVLREIRDTLSADIQRLNHEELQTYFRKRKKLHPALEAASQEDPTSEK